MLVASLCVALVAVLLANWPPRVVSAQGASEMSLPESLSAAFASAGYEVDRPVTWDWLTPPVISVRVHDRQRQRVVLVTVYSDPGLAGDAFRSRPPTFAYDASTWLDQVTLYESDEVPDAPDVIGCEVPAPTATPEATSDVDNRFLQIALSRV